MRITILSQWYAPEPNTRITPLARYLHSRGHDVLVITGFPNYPLGRIYPGYKVHWRQWEEIDGVRVLRLAEMPDHSRSAVRRTLHYFSFAASASFLGSVLGRPADVLWVYHPPLTVGIPALVMHLMRGIPFVFEIQDLWPETLPATGMLSNPRVLFLLDRLARTIYKGAAAITVISQGFKDNLVLKGVPSRKVHVISNWADDELDRPVEPDAELAALHGLAGRFNVVFGGNLGAAQDLMNLIEAASLLSDLPQLQFVLIGDGVDEPRLRQAVDERRLNNVRFIGRQPPERMPQFYALAEALLVHLRDDPLFEITIPSKTITYLACGRPILNVARGDSAQVVTKAGAGLVCPPADPRKLAETVREFIALPPLQRQQMAANARTAYLEDYSRAVLLERYEELFASIARSRGTHCTR